MKTNQIYVLFALVASVAVTAYFILTSPKNTPGRAIASEPTSENVKEILDNRCVACHSCYNAPCQLKVSSYSGVLRGLHPRAIITCHY